MKVCVNFPFSKKIQSLISSLRFFVSLFWNLSIAGLDHSQVFFSCVADVFDTGAPTKIRRASFFLGRLLHETLPSNLAEDTITWDNQQISTQNLHQQHATYIAEGVTTFGRWLGSSCPGACRQRTACGGVWSCRAARPSTILGVLHTRV